MISKWKWKPLAADKSIEEWKLRRASLGLEPQTNLGTWPGRPLRRAAGSPWLERFTIGDLCPGCGGDYQFKGALKVNIDNSEYTGYKYFFNKPGYRIKARSCEDARFVHINFALLAEMRYFEKVSVLYCNRS